MDPSQLPFANVRQRGYAHRLNSVAGHSAALGSMAAVAMQKPVADQLAGQLSPGRAQQQSTDMQKAIDELATLKTQLSGVEAAVTLIKASASSSPGRSSPSHGRRAVQQQQLGATPTSSTSSTSPRAGPGSPSHRLPLHQQNPAIAGGKLVALKPVAAAADPFAGAAAAAAGHSANTSTNSSRSQAVPGATQLSNAAAKPRSPTVNPAGAAAAASCTGRSSPGPAGPSFSSVSRSGGSQSPSSKAQHSSMTEADMQSVIQDPVNHLLRQSYNILGFPQSQQAAAAAAATQHGSSTSSVPIVPVTRNEAVQLEERVQKALPPGAIFAAQQQHATAWAKQQQRHWKQQLVVQADVLQQYQQLLAEQQQQQQQGSSWQGCEVLNVQLILMQQAMDTLLREVAQQVAYHCVEHGRVVDHLRERYAELANALYLSISNSNHQLTAISGALTIATAAATAAQHSRNKLQQQLAAKQAEGEDLQSNVTTWQLKHDQLVTESQEEIRQLNQQVLISRRQLWQLRDDRESDQAAAELAAAAAREEAEGKLAAAEETNLNLMQRLAFVQAQLQALRDQQRPPITTANQESQTDPPAPPPAEPEPSEPEPESESNSEDEIAQEYEQPPKKKQRKVLDLLKFAKRGQVRSQLWVVKVIGQLYADKAVADAAADAQGQGRSGIAEFIMKWHMNRYGLRHMATEALSDLLASTCHYAAAGSRPAYWFAHFCNIAAAIPRSQQQQQQQEEKEDDQDGDLLPGQQPDLAPPPAAEGDPQQQQQQQQQSPARSRTPSAAAPAAAGAATAVKLDLELLLATPAALDFYLFCCCQLAYPNSVIALFPEGEDALPLVRSSLVMESLKAVFRYLGDPDGQALFVARRLDLAAAAAAPTSSSGAAAAVDISISRSAASASSPKGLLPGRSSPAAAAAASARSNLASGSSSSSNTAEQHAMRELMSRKPLNLRAAAAEGAAAGSSSGSSRDRGGSFGSMGGGSSSSSIVGGFGYYSAWALLDLFMSEWVDRVAVNASQMAELRRTIAAMQPTLQSQVSTAAAAESRPALLIKLQEAKSALDQQLKPPLEAAAAAAALARSRSRRSGSDDEDDQEDESADLAAAAAAAGNSSNLQQKRGQLRPHVLVADGTMMNAAAAWAAYQTLLSCIQAIRDRAVRPPSSLGTTQQAAAVAAADVDDRFVSAPVTAEAAAAEIAAAAQQGVILSDALQQQLRELGLATAGSPVEESAAVEASSSAAGAAVMQDVLRPGGMASALQAARAKRAAAAAMRSQSGSASTSGVAS